MKKHLFLWLGILCVNILIAQELEFSFVASDPAYCRTAGYQNGNGVVYASATGGVPDYSFLWTDLTTGETSTNSTWGGRNPGCYELSITDMVGTMITTTVCVDSLNPVANMAVISDDVLGGPIYFTGNAPATVTFENLSLNVPDPLGPDGVIRYYFKPTGAATTETATSLATDFIYTYEYGGVWTASLVAKNINGCTDTVYLSFTIDGPSEVEEVEVNVTNIITNALQQTLLVGSQLNNVKLYVYNLGGQILVSFPLVEGINELQFNQPKGMYIYEIRNEVTDAQVGSGTFMF